MALSQGKGLEELQNRRREAMTEENKPESIMIDTQLQVLYQRQIKLNAAIVVCSLMKRHNLSVYEVAAKADMKLKVITECIEGKWNASLDEFATLCAHLGAAPHFLLRPLILGEFSPVSKPVSDEEIDHES
jgi:hypothetical protein